MLKVGVDGRNQQRTARGQPRCERHGTSRTANVGRVLPNPFHAGIVSLSALYFCGLDMDMELCRLGQNHTRDERKRTCFFFPAVGAPESCKSRRRF